MQSPCADAHDSPRDSRGARLARGAAGPRPARVAAARERARAPRLSSQALTRSRGSPRAEPMLQLLCTVLQAEVAVLTLADGNRLVMRKGAVEVCEPGEPAERAGVWAWAPLPVEHELVVVEDTRLDERCGARRPAPGSPAAGACVTGRAERMSRPGAGRPGARRGSQCGHATGAAPALVTVRLRGVAGAGGPQRPGAAGLCGRGGRAAELRRAQVPGAGWRAGVRGRRAALLLRDAARRRHRQATGHAVRARPRLPARPAGRASEAAASCVSALLGLRAWGPVALY